MKHIVKRNGVIESFDERKVYASIYASCLSVHEPTQAAELIANKVCADISDWLSDKNEVTSKDIRHQAAVYLQKINPHASYLYAHHRIMW